jgi:hypothetical protein
LCDAKRKNFWKSGVIKNDNTNLTI